MTSPLTARGPVFTFIARLLFRAAPSGNVSRSNAQQTLSVPERFCSVSLEGWRNYCVAMPKLRERDRGRAVGLKTLGAWP